MYDYEGDLHNQRRPSSRGSKVDSVNGYGGGMGHHQDPYGDETSFGNAIQGDDDDDMW